MTSRMQRTLLPEIVPLFQQLGQLSLKPGEAFMIRVERLKVFNLLADLADVRLHLDGCPLWLRHSCTGPMAPEPAHAKSMEE